MAVIVLAAALAAFLWPGTVGHIRTSWITPLLGIVMFGMGLTLDIREFRQIFLRPKEIITGVVCQFTIMPLIAYLLTVLFSLPAELAIGVILVGCCPGGTSSNVITYLAKGDIALSVGMTSVSTLCAPILTPLLLELFAGTIIPIDFWGMFLSIVEVIILPITMGLLAKKYLPKVTKAMTDYLPAFSSIVITIIVVAVVAANATSLQSSGALVILIVILHNIIGFLLGYLVSRLLHLSTRQSTAVSIEVGMQNSGLACSLASTHFPSLAMASVPGAIFSVWHNISGSIAARLFSRLNSRNEPQN